MIRSNLGSKPQEPASGGDLLEQTEKYRSRGEDRAAALVQGATGKQGFRRQASVGSEDLRGVKAL
jgi:hypothetical protein